MGPPLICLIRFPFAENEQPLHNFSSCFLSIKTKLYMHYVDDTFSKPVKKNRQAITSLNNCH